jgi:hypothetical protein
MQIRIFSVVLIISVLAIRGMYYWKAHLSYKWDRNCELSCNYESSELLGIFEQFWIFKLVQKLVFTSWQNYVGTLIYNISLDPHEAYVYSIYFVWSGGRLGKRPDFVEECQALVYLPHFQTVHFLFSIILSQVPLLWLIFFRVSSLFS